MVEVDLAHIQYRVTALLFDGSNIVLDNAVENLAWEENKNELAVRLNLTLHDICQDFKKLSDQLALCTEIYIHADWGEGLQEVFQGSIWEIERSETSADQLIVTCYDPLYYLQKSTDNRYYPAGTTTQAIITDILSSWGVPIGTYAGPNIGHEKLLFKNKSLAAMLTETIEDAVKVGADDTVFRWHGAKVDILAAGDNETVFEFDDYKHLSQVKDRYSMVNLVTRVIITGKDDTDGNGRPPVEATVDGKTEYGILQAIQSMGSGTLEEAQKEAQKVLREKGKPEHTITLVSPDVPCIRKGDKIHVLCELLAGYFIVRGVTHNATTRTMQMEVSPSYERGWI